MGTLLVREVLGLVARCIAEAGGRGGCA